MYPNDPGGWPPPQVPQPPVSPSPYGPVSGSPYSPAPYGAPQPVVVVQPGPPTSGLAVASMVLGIVGLLSSCCAFGIPSILAVVFGHAGLNATKGGARGGQGMAVAGLVMGYIVFVPAIVLSVYLVFAGGLAAVSGTPTPTPTP